MQRSVILTAEEFDRLPVKIAEALYEHALSRAGFTAISKETGEPIVDRFKDWLTGVVVMAFHKATKS